MISHFKSSLFCVTTLWVLIFCRNPLYLLDNLYYHRSCYPIFLSLCYVLGVFFSIKRPTFCLSSPFRVYILALKKSSSGKQQKKYFFSDSSLKWWRGGGLRGLNLVFLNCSRWKIKYILFKTTYPDIDISVYNCISVLCCRSANSQSLTCSGNMAPSTLSGTATKKKIFFAVSLIKSRKLLFRKISWKNFLCGSESIDLSDLDMDLIGMKWSWFSGLVCKFSVSYVSPCMKAINDWSAEFIN